MKKTFIIMCSLVALSSTISFGMKKPAWGDMQASQERKQAWGTKDAPQQRKNQETHSYKDAVTNTTSSSQKMMYRSSRQVVAQFHEEEKAKNKSQSAQQPEKTLLKRNEAPVPVRSVQNLDEESDDVPLFIPTQPSDEEAPELPEQTTTEFDKKALARLALMADMLPKVLANHEKVITDQKNQLQALAQVHADQMQTMALHFQQQLSAAHREFDTQMLAQQKTHFAQIEQLTKAHAAELASIHQILGLQNYHLYTAFVRLGLTQPITVEEVEQQEQTENQAE